MKFFYLFLLLVTSSISANDPFAYISYSSFNIGDDIQSIAAKQFLPPGSLSIDREFIGDIHHSTPIHTLVNGWYMHTKNSWYRKDVSPPDNSWPPAPCINPLLISLHFTKSFIPEAFTEDAIDYLKQHGPVGARDFYTLQELQKREIPAYFSGCLTLTLQNPHSERNNIIYVVDLDDKIVQYIKAQTQCKVVKLTHILKNTEKLTHKERIEHATSLLEKYQKAKCVITSRLHAAMPCLAFETPVLLINTQRDQYRFSGLKELARNCSRTDLLKGKSGFDFTHPAPNPKHYLLIRDNLNQIISEWVSKNQTS